ncbi:hypothetical protein ABT364_25000 [Massilia sp. SR12]
MSGDSGGYLNFNNHSNRLSELYFSGLRDMLEYPRDVVRIVNATAVIEPALRGEIVFADILALAALKVKATPVYDLLRKEPKLFVGRLPHEFILPSDDDTVIKVGQTTREDAYQRCARPIAVKEMVHYLFPKVARSDTDGLGQAKHVEGHLADPNRLVIALQLGTSMSDVSLVSARRYLAEPDQRTTIRNQLTTDNCFDFLETLAAVDASMKFGTGIVRDLIPLCIDIARIIDTPLFVNAMHSNGRLAAENTAEYVINQLSAGADYSEVNDVAEKIVSDGHALSVSAQLLSRTYQPDNEESSVFSVKCGPDKERLVSLFAETVIAAVQRNDLFVAANPSFILRTLARLGGEAVCAPIFIALQEHSPLLDDFVMALMGYARDEKGVIFRRTKDLEIVNSYCGIDFLKNLARLRLEDSTLKYPAKAAWRAVIEDKPLYGIDGMPARL